MQQTYLLEMTKALVKNHHSKRGLSLIEILIAVAIFVSSFVLITPWIQRSENNLKKNLRKIQAINKSLYNYSRIRNKAYRLALHTSNNQSSFWVESRQPVGQSSSSNLFKKDEEFSKETSLPNDVYFDWEDSEKRTLYVNYFSHSVSPPVKITLKNSSKDLWNLHFKPIVGELTMEPVSK